MTTDDQKRSTVGGEVRDGIRAGLGILSAMKDAIEDTIEELLGKGETPVEGDDAARQATDRAREAARKAARQAADRLDVVTRDELDAVRAEVAELRARLDALDGEAEDAEPAG